MRRVLAPGINAIKSTWRAFIFIQILCLLFVVGFYTVPSIARTCAVLAQWKVNAGLLGAALSVAVAAVIIPETARRITRTPRDKPLTIGDIAFQFLYFAGLGIAIDTLYKGLGMWLGDDPSPRVVSEKVLFDMFIFSGLFSMPTATVLFAWRDGNFRFRPTAALLKRGGFLERYVPLLVTCWAFWFPVMACLYSLPVNLQFVFVVLAEAAWCLLLVSTASRTPEVDKTIA